MARLNNPRVFELERIEATRARNPRHFPAMRSSCVPSALPVTTAGQRGGTDGTDGTGNPGALLKGYSTLTQWECTWILKNGGAVPRNMAKHMVGTSIFWVSEMAVDGQLKLRKDAQYADMIF